jgi:hypothetical protein
MVGTWVQFMVGNKILPFAPSVISHEDIRKRLLQGRFPICHPSIVFRKEAFEKVGGYAISGAGEDLDFFLRMTEVGRVCNIPTVLLHYRISNNSLAIRKIHDLRLGYSYALYSAECRFANVPVVDYFEFKKQWARRGWFLKFTDYCYVTSELCYRAAIVSKAEDKILKSFFCYAGGAIMRPKAALDKLLVKFKSL